MTVVADTGPLLALAKVDGLELLSELHAVILTPPAVRYEAVEAGLELGAEDALLIREAYRKGQLEVRTPTLAALPVLGRLGWGEDESIRLAIELRAELLLMDDFYARQNAADCFAFTGVPTTIRGTLGTIVTAFQRGVLSRERALGLLEALRMRPDIWLSRALCDRVMMLVREAPDE